MNRTAHLRKLATPAGMKAAALTQSKRRGDYKTHPYVVGGLRLINNCIVLVAVEKGAAWNIIRPIRLTANATLQYRWRTKQAAAQFIDRHQLPDLHVWHTGWLDILPWSDPRCPGDNPAAAAEAPLPAGQAGQPPAR